MPFIGTFLLLDYAYIKLKDSAGGIEKISMWQGHNLMNICIKYIKIYYLKYRKFIKNIEVFSSINQ